MIKPTDRTTFALAAVTIAFLLLVPAFTAHAQSCVTPSDDAEYCLVPDATVTPFELTATPVPTMTPTPLPTAAPTVVATVVIQPWERRMYLPIVNR